MNVFFFCSGTQIKIDYIKIEIEITKNDDISPRFTPADLSLSLFLSLLHSTKLAISSYFEGVQAEG